MSCRECVADFQLCAHTKHSSAANNPHNCSILFLTLASTRFKQGCSGVHQTSGCTYEGTPGRDIQPRQTLHAWMLCGSSRRLRSNLQHRDCSTASVRSTLHSGLFTQAPAGGPPTQENCASRPCAHEKKTGYNCWFGSQWRGDAAAYALPDETKRCRRT